MNKAITAAVSLAVLLAACGGSAEDGVATLEDTAPIVEDADATTDEPTDEEAILAFSQCMRDNGIEDFEDPEFDADGSIRFGVGRLQGDRADRDTARAAFEACQEHLEGLAFGPGSFDLTEIEDTLYEFASCMRDNGYDMPDPDFSNLVPRSGGGGPFGDDGIDPDDPAFQSALEQCQDVFEGGFRLRGGRGGDG